MYIPDIVRDTHYVFYDDSLLKRLTRNVERTFDEIFQSVKHILLKKYGTVENIVVVSDGGYLVPSTKGSKHIRRSKERLRRKTVPSLHNSLTAKKGDFLLHKHNKQAFIEMLGTQFSSSGIIVMHSDEDANVDIVSSALTVANTYPVTLLREYANMLIPSSLALQSDTSPLCVLVFQI